MVLLCTIVDLGSSGKGEEIAIQPNHDRKELTIMRSQQTKKSSLPHKPISSGHKIQVSYVMFL